MPKATHIIVRGQFEFIHRYTNAPQEVAYLRSMHRHIANYEVELEVFHDDRELEFIMVKHEIDSFIESYKRQWPETISCEQVAMEIAKMLQANHGFDRYLTVAVFEDNENGAKIIM